MAETKEKKKKKAKAPETPSNIDAKRFPKKIKRRQQMPRGPHHNLQLLLVEDVPHLGKQGEVVEVKPGYGRNYLIPHGLATHVSPETLVRIEKHKAKVEALRIAKLADLKMLAKEIEKHSITIEANANEDGHLYGSVTAVEISRALKKDNFKVEEDFIKLEGPLKELGLYHVKIQLTPEVETEAKVWVVPVSGQASAAK